MDGRKVICLMSDGLDSPVATYLLEKEGLEVIGLNFNNFPLVKPVKRKKPDQKRITVPRGQVKNIAQKLVNAFSHQKEFRVFLVPNGEDLKRIVEHASDPKLICVLCKRLMLKKAEQFALKLGAEFVATGEILGEQASQTIDNLWVNQSALTSTILLRPNIGLNKEEVTRIARTIGTYQHSELAAKFTCGAVPVKPSTHAKIEEVLAIEKELSLEEAIKTSFEHAQEEIFKKEVKKKQ